MNTFVKTWVNLVPFNYRESGGHTGRYARWWLESGQPCIGTLVKPLRLDDDGPSGAFIEFVLYSNTWAPHDC